MKETKDKKIERLEKALTSILEVRVTDRKALDKCRAIAARNLYKDKEKDYALVRQ